MRRVCLVGAAIHFAVIIAVSTRETLWLAANSLANAPAALTGFARAVEPVVAAALGRQLSRTNPFRVGVATYANLAGIETGYGYFAPNIGSPFTLEFEVEYPDHRVDRLPAPVGSSGLRFASLLDKIGQATYAPFREVLLRRLAYSVWLNHPDAATVRVILLVNVLPGVTDFKTGEVPSSEVIARYEFNFTPKSDEARSR